MSAYLMVGLSVLASATATLTLNLLSRLEWRRTRAWTRPAAEDTPAEPGELLEARQGACGCLTVTGAIALLHEHGYLATRPAASTASCPHLTGQPVAQRPTEPLSGLSPARHIRPAVSVPPSSHGKAR